MQQKTEKLPLSVSIISYNEEKNIGRTLESISRIAVEIVVLDTYSTDRTKEIAESFGAKVFHEDWKGHISQKNSAATRCTQEWILFLDCDEVVSHELETSILEAIKKPTANGYEINRKTFYIGKLLKHAWQPDWNLRLVRKDSSPVWEGLNPHDELKISGNTEKLKGDLVHYSYNGISHHFQKTIDYAKTSAQSYHDKGRKFSLMNLMFNPCVAFFRLYFLRRGFLDGIHGLIAGFSTFAYTFLKYIFLWEIEKTNK